jgi:peptide/nickel transport system permease protein
MGTDNLGRDILSGVLYGARTALLIGFIIAIFGIFIGTILGAISGYYGGLIDDLLMRITEMLLIIPKFAFALVIVVLFGHSLNNIILALSLVAWPQAARLVRAQYSSLRSREYVEAAKAVGVSNFKIIFSEILLNALFIIIVQFSFETANAILLEACLSFLGVGDPNIASWGLMLNNAQRFLRRAWWMSLFPGLAIFLTILGLNLVGDALNDCLNPRLQGR